MKKLGLFLLKYNIHLMTLVFIGCAIRAACCWSQWLLVQKLVMGMFAFMIVHEYEETMSKPNLLDLITRVTGLDTQSLTPGKSHLAQSLFIVALFALALTFPDHMWLVLPVFILGIFEGFVHTMGSFIFRLGNPSPGWYTGILMCAYSIWALVAINRHIAYDNIQWLYAALFFVSGFAFLEIWFHHLIGSSLPLFARKMRAFVFGTRRSNPTPPTNGSNR